MSYRHKIEATGAIRLLMKAQRFDFLYKLLKQDLYNDLKLMICDFLIEKQFEVSSVCEILCCMVDDYINEVYECRDGDDCIYEGSMDSDDYDYDDDDYSFFDDHHYYDEYDE